MAKVIRDEQTAVVKPWWARVRIIFTGASLGLVWWVLTVLIKNYIVEPIACHDLSSAVTCVNSSGVAGSIGTVLVALIGAFVLVRAFQPRPIIIAVSVAVVLWSLGYYIAGLQWYEGLLWGAVLYAITYLLFGLVARIVSLPLAITTAIVIALGMRILLVLY